ncbi:MAG: polysaccharide biosynthesis protein [Proteobacteria bacterium]|nr:polysaccharide biosynthesis protein [Pseudomonadota bacterium]
MQATLALAGLALHVMLPRALPIDEYGAYQTVLSMVTIAAVFSGLRVNLLTTQKVAQDPASGGQVVGAALRLVGMLAVPTSLLLISYAATVDGRPSVVKIALAACVALVFYTSFSVLQGAVQGLRKMQHQLPAVLTWKLGELGSVAIALMLGANALGVHWIRAGWTLIAVLILWRSVSRLIELRAPWNAPHTEAVRLGKECIPFGIDGLFASAYLAADVLVLAYFHGDVAVAVYGVAAVPVANLVIVGFVVNRVLHPVMAAQQGNPDGVGGLLGLGVRLHLVVSLPIAVGGMLVAEPLLVFVFGEPFAASARPFMLMLPLLPFRYINHALGLTLTALGLQPLRAKAIGLVAATNLALNFLLVPTWGVMGAAATTLFSELFLVLLYGLAVRPRVRGVNFGGTLLRASISLIPLVWVVGWMSGQHVLLRVLCGAAAYLVMALGTGALDRSDVRNLRRA